MERLGEQGLRIMAAAMRDIDPSDFDPDGDLLVAGDRTCR